MKNILNPGMGGRYSSITNWNRCYPKRLEKFKKSKIIIAPNQNKNNRELFLSDFSQWILYKTGRGYP